MAVIEYLESCFTSQSLHSVRSQRRLKFDRSIFINKFTAEAREHLQKLNEGLVNLEKTPDAQDLIQELFRSAHTVKGSSRMMGFTRTNQVTHKMEDLLGLVRDGQLTLTEMHYDLLFEALDLINTLLDEISSDGEEKSPVEGIVARLEKAVMNEQPAETASPEGDAAAPQFDAKPVPLEPAQTDQTLARTSSEKEPTPPEDAPKAHRKADETIRVKMETLDQTIKSVGELIVGRMRARKHLEKLNDIRLRAKELQKNVSDTRPFWEAQNDIEPWEALFDQVTAIVTELESLYKRNRESNTLHETIVTELEENAFQMRMLPLSTIFGTFPRAVRDIAREMGKKLELVMNGEETQLDKKMIEKLDGPLNHILRNCIDHGIERPEDRLAKGKPEKGLIHLNAFSESGNVIIEINDDGNGLNTEAIKQKALQKNLVREEDLVQLSERDIQNFIFLPGFSTSAIITDISGRGVGLDVVRKNVEDLKGSVAVDSEPGKGTRFTITLPLTLSALRVLLVKTRGFQVALPVSAVRETVLIRKEDIIKIVDRQAIRLRNQIITLVELGAILKLAGSEQAPKGNEYFVIVGEVAKERIGFVVDDIVDEVEVVQKPLPVFIQKLKNISGVTVLGDNEIVLILYMSDLIDSARRLSKVSTEARRPVVIEKAAVQEILVVDDSLNTREVEKSIIEAHGYKVDLAKDGLDALKKTEKKQYDLIVTDVEMPQMDGFTLTQNLRETEKYADTPIIIVTSRERDEDKRRGIEVGANAYIVKGSFDQNNLIDTIESLIG